MKVMVAMSGGIDSTVAAAKLCEDGHEVVGLHMRIWFGGEPDEACSSEAQLADAQEVRERYGFEIHQIDLSENFKNDIVDYFIDDYLSGKTPNPCVHCNRKVKFGLLMEQLDRLDCEVMATGHYTQVLPYEPTGRMALKRMHGYEKDQTYFLSRLSQEQLGQFMPVWAGWKKHEAREYARSLGLKVADKPESTEICFLPGGDYRSFVADIGKHAGSAAAVPGDIVDSDGKVLGRHEGLANYTIGQRRGLGIAHSEPLYVLELDMKRNMVVVGEKDKTLCDAVYAEDINWMGIERPDHPIRVASQIRYRNKPTLGWLYPQDDGTVEVVYDTPVSSPAPGQALAFYDAGADWLLGGGWITGSR